MICKFCNTQADDARAICSVCNMPYDTSKYSPHILRKLKENIPGHIKRQLEFEKLKSMPLPKPYIPPTQAKNGNELGNFIFILLHVMAVFFGFFPLFFTIPAHLIYLVLVNK